MLTKEELILVKEMCNILTTLDNWKSSDDSDKLWNKLDELGIPDSDTGLQNIIETIDDYEFSIIEFEKIIKQLKKTLKDK